MSSCQSNPLMKKENTFYSVNEGIKQAVPVSKLQCYISQHLYSSSINISIKRWLGFGVSFFHFFFCDLLGNRLLLVEKSIFRLTWTENPFKEIMKQMKMRMWQVCFSWLIFLRKGHVVNDSRVFLSWRWPNLEGLAILVRQGMRLWSSAWLTPNIIFNR